MKVTFKRFGLSYNPQKDKKNKNKIIRHIVWFLIAFIAISVLLTLVVEALIRISIAKLAINDTIDSTWIGSLASYWGRDYWWNDFRNTCFYWCVLYYSLL